MSLAKPLLARTGTRPYGYGRTFAGTDRIIKKMLAQHKIKHLHRDDKLKRVMEATILSWSEVYRDVYSQLIRSIVYQQLSTKAATTIYGRFMLLFPDDYPVAEQILNMDMEELRAVGLSRQKAAYIRNVAAFFLEEELFDLDWDTKSNEEILHLLTQIKGVGKWTVQMLLMFTLEREDIFPVNDLGIQQAMIRLYGLEGDKKSILKQMEALAEPWRPYRTLACFYLWQWKDEKP